MTNNLEWCMMSDERISEKNTCLERRGGGGAGTEVILCYTAYKPYKTPSRSINTQKKNEANIQAS